MFKPISDEYAEEFANIVTDLSPHQVCNKCHEMKPWSAFSKHTIQKNGLRQTCRPCVKQCNEISQYFAKHYQENKDRILQHQARYYQKNKFRINERTKLYQQKNGKKNYQKNKSKILSRQKEYKQKNKDRFKQRHKLYYQKNKARIYQYLKNKKQIDFNFKLKHVLRSRIHNALKSKCATKDLRTIELLGCSISNFRAHIEKQFVAGMSWETHGNYGWHLVYFVLYFFQQECVLCLHHCICINNTHTHTHTHLHTYSRTISSRAQALI